MQPKLRLQRRGGGKRRVKHDLCDHARNGIDLRRRAADNDRASGEHRVAEGTPFDHRAFIGRNDPRFDSKFGFLVGVKIHIDIILRKPRDLKILGVRRSRAKLQRFCAGGIDIIGLRRHRDIRGGKCRRNKTLGGNRYVHVVFRLPEHLQIELRGDAVFHINLHRDRADCDLYDRTFFDRYPDPNTERNDQRQKHHQLIVVDKSPAFFLFRRIPRIGGGLSLQMQFLHACDVPSAVSLSGCPRCYRFL